MKKWGGGGGQLDIRPPNLKIGGDVFPPSPPRIDALGLRALTSLRRILKNQPFAPT